MLLPNFEKKVSLNFLYLLISITPFLVDSNLETTIPFASTNADMPLFVDLIMFFPSSIDLKIVWEKC